MWTRNALILAFCLASSSVLAAAGAPEGAEMIPTPSPYAQAAPSMAGPVAGPVAYDAPGTLPTRPWFYWWSSWHWFDRYHDRGQHYAYLPPLPGWYYFRPYSVGQLRAQQEAVMQWGGDPRNPYATGLLPQQPPQQQQQARRRPAAPVASSAFAKAAAAPPQASIEVIPWPSVLRDPRFAGLRASMEAPYRRDPKGQSYPVAGDYQGMINAIEQMQVVLGQMTPEISVHDAANAEKFLSQLAAETREQAQVALVSATSEAPSAAPPIGHPDQRVE